MQRSGASRGDPTDLDRRSSTSGREAIHVEIIFFSIADAGGDRALVLERHGRRVLERDPGRVEHRHLVVGLAALELAADHLADLARDVVLGDQALGERRR